MKSIELPSTVNTVANLLIILSFTLLAGAFGFRALVLEREVLNDFRHDIEPALQRYMWCSLILTAIAVAAATLLYAYRAGVSSLIGRYGFVLAGRIGLLLVLMFLVRARKTGVLWSLIPAALLLLTQSLLSHSAAEPDWLMPVIADWVHFTFTALWLGGVAVLALIVAPVGFTNRTRLIALGITIARFSPLAIFSVFAIAFTGVAQSASFVGSIDALLTTTYGRAILIKGVLLMVLIAFGAFHQQSISPRLLEWRLRDLAGAQTASRRFRISILAEAFVSLCLLVVVAVLVASPLARDVAVDSVFNLVLH